MPEQLDWMVSSQMKTTRMDEFFAQVSAAHADEFGVMALDAASSHVVKVVLPQYMQLLKLPPLRSGAQPSGACLRRAAKVRHRLPAERCRVRACRGHRFVEAALPPGRRPRAWMPGPIEQAACAAAAPAWAARGCHPQVTSRALTRPPGPA
jgi:hypothetical protein